MITSIDEDKCWPEDYGFDNGCYYCRCHDCKAPFLGHKRRFYCKMCDKITPPPMTDADKKALVDKILFLSGVIAEHEKNRTEYLVILNKELLN
jgi:hypothetical protein